jgi:FkbM family methyltransferase
MLAAALIKQIESIIDRFLSESVGREVILYGAGFAAPIIYGILQRHDIPVAAVADSNPGLHGTLTTFGAEIMSLNAARARHPSAKVLISSPRYFLEIRNRLISEIGSENVYSFDLYNAHYFSGASLRALLLAHYDDYAWLYGRLEDELSRVTLDRIIWAHLTGSVENFMHACSGTEDWYAFRELIRPRDDDVYVDCGAFDGDTVLLFDRVAEGRYRAMIACEPNPRVFAELARNTADLPADRVHLVCAGTGLEESEFELVDEGYFSATQARSPASSTGSGIRHRVQLRPLDTIAAGLRLEPSIIKMDIEGAEHDALRGATCVISRGKPRLSICLYHRHEDILRIPRLIDSIRGDYRFHLRHQSASATDTILVAR